MPRNIEPGIGQGMLFVPEAIKAPELPEGFDLDRRTTFSHLIAVISEHVDLPYGYTTAEDLGRVDPANIEPSLCFGTFEARKAPRKLINVYHGIGFSALQFTQIARSPEDLANIAFSTALTANEKRPEEGRLDRDTAKATATRAAVHALDSNSAKLEAVKTEIAQQYASLEALYSEITAPQWAHWSGRNLDALRKTASDIIHGDIEIAAANLPWDNNMADGIQRALHYNLYGRRGHNNVRISFWRRYVMMARDHSRRQMGTVSESMRRLNRVYAMYAPSLDATPVDEK